MKTVYFSVYFLRAKKLAAVPPVGRHVRVAVQIRLNPFSDCPVRDHTSVAQCETGDRIG
jgi:hypothetical protein